MAEGPQIATRMSSRERIVVLLLVISVVINYVDRSNLSLAVPLIQRQFALLPLQIGSLLSAFFWTYALLQISGVAGWLSDRFPVGWVKPRSWLRTPGRQAWTRSIEVPPLRPFLLLASLSDESSRSQSEMLVDPPGGQVAIRLELEFKEGILSWRRTAYPIAAIKITAHLSRCTAKKRMRRPQEATGAPGEYMVTAGYVKTPGAVLRKQRTIDYYWATDRAIDEGLDQIIAQRKRLTEGATTTGPVSKKRSRPVKPNTEI
jgi:hypothetical protein